jgi:hypothetical protein
MRFRFAITASLIALLLTVALLAWVYPLASAAVALGGAPAERQPIPPVAAPVRLVHR